jgi:hypothetical protein
LTGSWENGKVFSTAGGGYAITFKTDDEGAINLVARSRKHASAEIDIEFYDIEEVPDPSDTEDPSQLTLGDLEDED